jgi:hypothetical protein
MAPRLISDRMLDLFRLEDRSPGRHVSTAIFAVMKRLHPDRFTDDPINQARANLGNALERALIDEMAQQFPDRYVRPGELRSKSGVTGTPDLWDMWGGASKMPRLQLPMHKWAVVEVKLSWATASRADDISDVWFWRYWQQGRAYCRLSGMRKVILIIYFINGTWIGGKPGQPCGLMFEDTFNNEELDDTWNMVELYS